MEKVAIERIQCKISELSCRVNIVKVRSSQDHTTTLLLKATVDNYNKAICILQSTLVIRKSTMDKIVYNALVKVVEMIVQSKMYK